MYQNKYSYVGKCGYIVEIYKYIFSLLYSAIPYDMEWPYT